MYKQIVIALLLLVSFFSVNAMPATNALAERNNENTPDKIIAKAEFRTAKTGFEATFTFVQLPSDGDNDSDDHRVFVTSLIVLSQSLRVEVLFDLTPFVKPGTEWCTVLKKADVKKLAGNCVFIANSGKRAPPAQSLINLAP
ncbi:6542_t:CDS:2 [Paraglomus brasilianum]|uniref:6542_t:CDS:1 n=1 Tax=Paraglomus brasilianum TaxID=144538 RepID=A0A9N9CJV0_9GLOM|nr:6542_t:CDS:2 [Paraglomus brasilianum]